MPKLGAHWHQWRERMLEANTLTSDDVAELESHMIDSVTALVRVGLTHEESVLVSLRRLGGPNPLATEYLKANAGLVLARRWYWMALGFLGFSVAFSTVRFLGHLVAWLTLGTWPPDSWFLGIVLMGIGVLGLGVVGSARTAGGWTTREIHGLLAWVERRPLAASHLGFSVLGGLAILDAFATSFVWRRVSPDMLSATSTFEALATTAAPVGFFLLAVCLVRKGHLSANVPSDATVKAG